MTKSPLPAQDIRQSSADTNADISTAPLHHLLDLCHLGIALTDMQGRHIQSNESFRKMCGYTAAELAVLDHCILTPEKYAAEESHQLELLRLTGHYGPYDKELVRKDGSLVAVRLHGMLTTLNNGQRCVCSAIEDITAYKRTEADLRIAAAAFEAPVGIMVTDADLKILRVNQAFSADTGYLSHEAVGQTPYLLKSGRHDDAFYSAIWDSIRRTGGWQGEIWDRRKNGEVHPKWMTISAITDDDGKPTHYVSTQVDITESKAAENEIELLAFYDPLTRLPNRMLLMDRLRQAIAASTRSGQIGALLFIDLDHFKTLNDTLGHDKGDILLQQVAKRLTACVRESDTVARLGGDEFVIMQEGLSDNLIDAAALAKIVGEKVLTAFHPPFQLSEHELFSSPSIGITLFQDNRDQINDLLRRADLAMYQAKAGGRNAIRFFDPEMQAVLNARVTIQTELRRALIREEFVLYYQPQINAAGHMFGAEALLRWQHPGRGLVPPSEFVAQAEETGQIILLGQWVLVAACTQLAAWARSPATSQLEMAVNISARQFYHPDFVEQVLAIIESTGANPTLLNLELTESLLLTNFEDIVGKMSRLKERGICFSLDDFGTGYSSLSYLKRLPLDQLKIDQTFVRDIMTDPNDAAIARTIVTLGHSLGLSIIAEGVETEEQRTFLAASGCNAYQGYLFSPPLPINDLERYMTQNC